LVLFTRFAAPYTCPFANGYCPRSCGANGNRQRGRAEYSIPAATAPEGALAGTIGRKERTIKHIDCFDATVGEILLGEKHRLAIQICNQLVSGKRLPVSKNCDGGVMLSSDLHKIAVKSASNLLPRASSSEY